MAKVKRIFICSHASSNHVDWVLGLRSGFKELGINVVTSWPHPEPRVFNSIIENFRPDAVIEINRSKDQIKDLQHDICHISILQDTWAFGTNYSNTKGESDLYYSLIHPSHFGYPKQLDAIAKPFIPGVYPKDHLKNVHKKFDLGLIGYIEPHSLLNKKNIRQKINPSIPKLGTFANLFQYLKLDHTTLNQSTYVSNIRNGITRYFIERGLQNPHDYPNLLRKLEEICSTTIVTTLNRSRLSKKMVEASSHIGFWGTSNWLDWSIFAPYYQEHLLHTETLMDRLAQLRIFVHSTKTNLHPKIIESMMVGTVTAVIHNDSDAGPFGIEHFFEPDVDFIRVTFDNFVEKVNHYLAHPKLLEEMSQNAYKKVISQHTWRHRCQEILQDLEAILS